MTNLSPSEKRCNRFRVPVGVAHSITATHIQGFPPPENIESNKIDICFDELGIDNGMLPIIYPLLYHNLVRVPF